jgi:hypothetical protein
MAQGSTGFSKQEIDALMLIINAALDDRDGDLRGPAWRAYLKLVGVQQRMS